MKKLILIGFIFCSSCIAAFSQFRVGGETGLNISSMGAGDKTAYESLSSLLGLNIGATGEYIINSDITLHGGLIFSQKGMNTNLYKPEEYGNFTSIKTKVRINYIDIPVLYHDFAQKANGGKVKLIVNVGPVISLAVSGKVDSLKQTKSGSATTSDKLKIGFSGNKYNLLNLGIHIGGGVEVYDMITAEVFYYRSFTKAQNEAHTWNSVLGISVGYIYKLP